MTTQRKITRDFYLANPNRDIPHEEAVDAIEVAYKQATGKKFRDPDRAIRLLHAEGLLQKISKGVYRYDPKLATGKRQENFTSAQKAEIMRRGAYRCAICGLGKRDGVELHIDHRQPKALGGEATIANGQILCAKHNFQKKNYTQTESAKRYFIGLHERAEELKDNETMAFVKAILEVYDEYDVNGHIEWKPGEGES